MCAEIQPVGLNCVCGLALCAHKVSTPIHINRIFDGQGLRVQNENKDPSLYDEPDKN